MPKRLALIILGFALVAAACGGGDDAVQVASLENETSTTAVSGNSPTSAEETEQAILELTSCLRDNGLDIEDPTVDASGNVDFGDFGDLTDIDEEVAEQALDACRDLLDGVTLGFADQIDFTAIEDGLLEYATCMRDNGFDLPDPDFSLDAFFGGGPDGERQGPFGDIDPEDPAFLAANEECEHILTKMFSSIGFGG